ncbi:MAG: M3 family metallopeptidase [Gemmatimonadota bacterium]|nr:M3 family metallopeptidase [Gemmatimonadota bacterium]
MTTFSRRGLCLSILVCASFRAATLLPAQETELPLDRLTPADARALVDRSIANASLSLERVLAVKGRRTIDNTLRPYDEHLIRFNAGQIVGLLQGVHPDSAVRAAAADGMRRRDSVSTSWRLDPRLYRALSAIDTSGADAETRYYLKRRLASFRRAGVDRDEKTRTRIAALHGELTRLERRFDENLRPDTTPVVFSNLAALDGMPADWLKAQPRGAGGEVMVSGDLRLVIQNARNRETRERAYVRLRNRGAPANHFVVDSLLRVRHELATLLGYRSWAAYQFEDHMARSPEGVKRFLNELHRLSQPAIARDLAHAAAREKAG